ncbi:MAG TPA: DUF3617 domain-containing protein [Terriglobia bacterium]|nr:DUF3617 domain-containing protein [Terriglobia bacterium]
MRKLILGSVICLSVELLLAAGGKYQPLNVKTGLWETTWTSKVTGRPPISPDMLANLTPEQRAKFEAAMNRMASEAPKTRTSKSCLTKEKLEKDPFSDKKMSCTETVLNSTGSKMEVHEVCTGKDMKTDVNVRIEAITSGYVKGTVQSNTTGGGNTMNVNGTFTSKYIGAVCKDTD